MLDAQDAFKVGFIARCIAEGVPTDRIVPLVKQAEEKLAGLGGMIAGGLGKATALGGAALSGVAGWGIPIAALAPPALGAAAGYGLARATDVDDTDVDEIKDTELMDEYRRQIDQLKRGTTMRRYAQNRKQTGRVFH